MIWGFSQLILCFRLSFGLVVISISNLALSSTSARFWIIETNGREYEDTDRKDATMQKLCKDISESGIEQWAYLRVRQYQFHALKRKTRTFSELLRKLDTCILSTVLMSVMKGDLEYLYDSMSLSPILSFTSSLISLFTIYIEFSLPREL